MDQETNQFVNPDQTGFVNPIHHLKIAKQEQNHEQTLLSEKNKHELEVLEKKQKHEIKCKNKDLGWLGFLFGGKELTALNISGFLIILLILIGCYLTSKVFKSTVDIDNVLKIWSIITPIITLTLGYIFGSKSTKSKK